MKKQPVYWLMVVGVIAASVVILSPLIDRVEAIIITISVIIMTIASTKHHLTISLQAVIIIILIIHTYI